MSLASGVGLVSGLPVNDIISQLLSLRQRPILNLQSKISDFQQKQAGIVSINNTLLELRNVASRLSDPSTFSQKSFSASDDSAITVTGSADASAGSFSVEVLQLASAQRIAAQGFADSDTTGVASTSGTFAFQVGSGAIESVSVDATTSLADLRDAINALDSGVRASIINDGSATNPFRLVLTSEETGAANEITVTTNDTTLDFTNTVIEEAVADSDNTFAGTITTSGTFTGAESQRIVIEVTTAGATGAAQFKVSTDGGVTFGPDNAFTTSTTALDIGDGVEVAFSADTFAVGDRFTIDTFNPVIDEAQDAVARIDGITVTRETNSIADAIEGVTIGLNEVTSSPVTVGVATDTTTALGRINTFVAQYNAVIDAIAGQTVFDPETNIRGALLGDSTVRSVQSTLALMISSRIPGLDNTEINSLAGIGISLGEGGRLVIDGAELEDALANNLSTVQKLFATVGTPDNSDIAFSSATSATASGTYQVNITQAAEQATISGNQAVVGNITSAETLTFTVGDVNSNVTIAAGSSLSDAVDALNAFFSSEGLGLTAEDDGGTLKISTEGYGSGSEFTVVSDQSGASASQLGIGTTERSDTGVDVAGTIGGFEATGTGQSLTGGTDTDVEGLVLTITGSSTGVIGNVTVSTGVGVQFENALETLTGPDNGILTARQDGLQASIDDINDQIERIQESISREEARLRSQFAGLETILAQFQQTSTFLSQQLSSLANLTTNSRG